MSYVTEERFAECPQCCGPAKVRQEFTDGHTGVLTNVVVCPIEGYPRHWSACPVDEVTLWESPPTVDSSK